MAGPTLAHWNGRPVAVTGGAGFLGRAVVRQLEAAGAQVRVIRSSEHDLRLVDAARDAVEGADTVVHLAAKVGGIEYNRRHPAPLLYDNLTMGTNVFEQSRLAGVRKLVAASSVCAYPKHASIPFREDEIWNGYPEESNATYGLAKKMLLIFSDSYRTQYGFDSCAPVLANLYGPDDNFDPSDSHVIAGMIRKFVEARDRGDDEVVLWGTGRPSREFLYVDDAARALILAAERLDTSQPVNIGSGQETRIRDLAETVCRLVRFEGEMTWDTSRPDGQMKRYLDVSRARELIGFEAEISLEDGLARTIESFERAGATL